VAKAALLDVDGTLVDANYQHTIAWYRAFREHDITLPLWRIHRAVGMGGTFGIERPDDAGTRIIVRVPAGPGASTRTRATATTGES